MSQSHGLLAISILVLFHAAYSMTEWRSFARNKTLEASVPFDIVAEVGVGLFLAMIAVLNIAGGFKEIRASVQLSQKSWENTKNRPSFYTFNHRGRAFSERYVIPDDRR